jgi:hypothetical protein
MAFPFFVCKEFFPSPSTNPFFPSYAKTHAHVLVALDSPFSSNDYPSYDVHVLEFINDEAYV